MARLKWHVTDADNRYENGVRDVILYKKAEGSETALGTLGYCKGVAWNGVTAISEKPTGGDTSSVYADDVKYLNLISNEDFAASIEALCYPDEFAACDGTKAITDGLFATQQKRCPFALCYRTNIGNKGDEEAGYKLHIIYGALASPSEKQYQTMNDNKEPSNFSWEITTTPIETGETGFRPTAHIEIDSTVVGSQKMAAIEDALYGKDGTSGSGTDATLKSPAELKALLA